MKPVHLLILLALACPARAGEPGLPVLGGKVAPDGKTEIQCDLPSALKMKNVGGRDGAGLCVFTSINWAAFWQNERALFELQKQMRSELGGGWPEKVDAMMKKYAPAARYAQSTGGDEAVLDAVLRSGRIACITYGGHDPHYRGTIAHMVCLVYFDEKWACVSDNNYPGDTQFVWMARAEFVKRWKMNGGGWCVFLLDPPPPPPPCNWRLKR